jgi:hypothetical protein
MNRMGCEHLGTLIPCAYNAVGILATKGCPALRIHKVRRSSTLVAVPTTIWDHGGMEVKGNQWTFRQHQQTKRCQASREMAA